MSPARIHQQTSSRVLTHLRAGVSVEVSGLPGSGRSRLADSVSSALVEDGYRVMTVHGLYHLRDRPLEALSAAGVVEGPTTSRAHPTLSAAVDWLSAVVARKPTVVVVDDLEDVDEATLGVLSAAHRRRRYPLLSVARPLPQVPSGRTRPHSLSLRPGVQVGVPPLRFDDVHALVVDALGGQVDPHAVRWVARRSGGLAGLVLAVTDCARLDGALVLRDGTWTVQHHRSSPHLSAVVDRLTEHATPEALEGLEVLSLVRSCDHEVARRLVGTDVLEELDDRQLVQLVPTGDRLVTTVFPPLVASYFRGSRASARRARLLQELPAALSWGDGWSPLAVTADERQVRHENLVTAGPDPAGRRADQTTVSVRRSDTVLAQMLAERRAVSTRELRAAWVADRTWRTAAPYLRAVMTCEVDEAAVESVLTTTVCDGDVEPFIEGALWHARYLAVEQHDLSAAVHLLTSLEPRATALGASEECLWRARLVRLRLESTLDRITPSHHELVLRADTAPPETRAAAAIHRAGLLVVEGRPVEALGLLDIATTDRRLAAQRDLVRVLALAFSGDVDDALGLARQHLYECRATLSVDLMHAYAYVVSIVLCLQGRTAELRENLSSALTLGGSSVTVRSFRAGNLAIAATVAMLDGRHVTGTALLEELESLRLPAGNLPAMSATWARGTVARSSSTVEHATASAHDLWSEAVDLLERGFVTAGIFAGVCAVELVPDPRWARRLVSEVELTDGALLADLADYSSAICSGDPERMASVGDRLVADGRPHYGLRAHTAAVRAWRALERRGRASAQLATARAIAARLGSEYLERLDPWWAGADLTHREQEVARLAAQGWSNQKIAASLVLSVRTVESHLHRAYRKVGVDNRQDLRAALTLDG